jgi:predicted small metal-binding protein
MAEAMLTVRCACGWETSGPEANVVADTVEHGRRMHNMVPSRDEVVAMAVGRDETPSDDEPEGGA